jgi:hypothetical protein
MMDERALELIHGELDGELNAGEQEELRHLSEASPDVRRHLERMRALRDGLDGLPVFEPPAGLRDAILARVPTRARDARYAHRREASQRRGRLGLVAAMAATMAVVVMVLNKGPELPELDPAALGGTIGRNAELSSPAMFFAESEVSGSIRLLRGEQGLVMEVDLDAARPISLVAHTDGRDFVFEGFVPIAGQPVDSTSFDGGIRISHDGRQHYAIVLTQHGAGSGAGSPIIHVSVYDGDRLIRESGLRLTAEGVRDGS